MSEPQTDYLAVIEAVTAVESRIHFRQDGMCWPDCPGCQVKAALDNPTRQVPLCKACAMGDSCRQHDPRPCCDWAEATGGDTHADGCPNGADSRAGTKQVRL